MAKKNKQNQQVKENIEIVESPEANTGFAVGEEVLVDEIVPEVVIPEVVIPEVKKEEPKPHHVEKINLHDACRRYVIGYKEYWLPSIKKFAISEGYSDLMTVDEAKDVLKKWGAKMN